MKAILGNMFVAIIMLLLCAQLSFGENNDYIQRYSTLDELNREVEVSDSLKSKLLSSQAFCSHDFLSLTLDSSLIRDKWKRFDFGSLKLVNLAAGLGPTNLRLGGTSADFLTFDPNGAFHDPEVETQIKQRSVKDDLFMIDSGTLDFQRLGMKNDHQRLGLKNDSNFTMTGKQWDSITTFAAKVGWSIMFDFNLFKWKDWPDGPWDSSNAEALLRYSTNNGIKISAFQLGNEPNSFYHNFNLSVNPSFLVSDLGILRQTVDMFPAYRGLPIYGPDVTSVGRHKGALKYMKQFLSAGGSKVVSAACWHHYYINGRTASIEQFLDPDVLDSFKEDLTDMLTLAQPLKLPLRITETSSCFGGGAPGISDRFVAGFMWLDKLGLSALANVTAVFRQTFFHGNYALISPSLDPNPDYWLSVLFKRLVLGPVLGVTTRQRDPHLRLYANCVSRAPYNYPPGAVVLYYLNVGSADLTLMLTGFEGLSYDLFLLSPGDSDGMNSRLVKLNNKVILMSGSELPTLAPLPHQGKVKVAAYSFGFIVVPQANIQACR